MYAQLVVAVLIRSSVDVCVCVSSLWASRDVMIPTLLVSVISGRVIHKHCTLTFQFATVCSFIAHMCLVHSDLT